MIDEPLKTELMEWVEFTADAIVAMKALTVILQFKEIAPQVARELPELLEYLVPLINDHVPPEKLTELRAKAADVSEKYKTHEAPDFARFAMEMLVSRIVDRFEWFLMKAVSRRLRRIPESIGSMQVELSLLLECSDLDEAIDRAIEKKIYQLSYAGLSEIAEFLKRTIGARIDTSSESFRIVKEVIEVRHLISHHGGKVSRVFLSRTGRVDLKIGNPFPLSPEWILDGLRALRYLSKEIYEQLSTDVKRTSNAPGDSPR
jgi:hypothetical protein